MRLQIASETMGTPIDPQSLISNIILEMNKKKLLENLFNQTGEQQLIDTSPEGLKKYGILDKATLASQVTGNREQRQGELQDAALGTAIGTVGAGALSAILSGGSLPTEFYVNNAMPGLNAVSTLINKQQKEDASDVEGYRSGSKNFFDALF